MISHVGVIPPNTSLSTRSSLHEGIAVTSSAAILIGLGFVAVYVYNRGIVPSVLVLTSAAGMGLTSGFISRFELPNRSPVVRWLVALFSLCAGMIPMGWLSQGVLGFDLINQGVIKPDWEGLLRLSLGAAAAWLAVRAWSGRSTSAMPPDPPTVESVPLAPAQPNSGRVVESPARMNPATSNRRLMLRPPTLRRSSSRGRALSLGRPKLSSNHSMKMPTIKGIRRKRRISTSIRLMDAIEHRCPFCLELVEPGDARGSVECSTCHTLHHADCWGVTGTCQVPHHTV